MTNRNIEHLQQKHARAVAHLSKVEAALERSSAPVSQGPFQGAQRALGNALAAIALGEQPEGDVNELHKVLNQARENYEDAVEGRDLRLTTLQRRRSEAQEAVRELHSQLSAAKNMEHSAVMSSMQEEIRAVPASMSVSKRMTEFQRIAEAYSQHPAKIEELWNHRW